MNKLTRIVVMGGFGLLAALATGVGPAQAATASGAVHSKPTVGQVQWRDGDQVVGYYRTPQGCELAGQFGERSGNWDDHYCSYVRLGLRRGAWALQVSSDDDWRRLGFDVPFRAVVGFPNQFRPVWPGQYRPGHRGHSHPGHRGPVRHGHSGPVRHDHSGPVRHDHSGPVRHDQHGSGGVGHLGSVGSGSSNQHSGTGGSPANHQNH